MDSNETVLAAQLWDLVRRVHTLERRVEGMWVALVVLGLSAAAAGMLLCHV